MLHRISLAITTYERPDALAAVLASVARQTQLPAEVLIADDGSGALTGAVVQAFARDFANPVRHIYQPHEGFRVARLRNAAIAQSQGDYLIFVDGDMVLHPSFIADHRKIARRGFFTQGVRLNLDTTRSARLIQDPTQLPGFFSPGLGLLRRFYLLRSTRTVVALTGLGNHLITIKSCNQGFWRDDLRRVNGFDQDFEGWGAEDKELCARLQHAGVQRQTLLGGGLAFHLAHPPVSRDRQMLNLARYHASIAERRVRCQNGLEQTVEAQQKNEFLRT